MITYETLKQLKTIQLYPKNHVYDAKQLKIGKILDNCFEDRDFF